MIKKRFELSSRGSYPRSKRWRCHAARFGIGADSAFPGIKRSGDGCDAEMVAFISVVDVSKAAVPFAWNFVF